MPRPMQYEFEGESDAADIKSPGLHRSIHSDTDLHCFVGGEPTESATSFGSRNREGKLAI